MRFLLCILLLSATAQAATWPGAVVTYSDATPRRFHESVDAAFAQWSEASGLRFERVKSAGQIEIKWDKRPLIAFYLAFTTWTECEGKLTSATVSINARQYRWHSGAPYTVTLRFVRKSLASFEPVILHEAGHSIGLPHSDDSADVMYPIIYGLTTLSAGDVKAAKGLYEK